MGKLQEALTKRALEKQFLRAGLTRRTAEFEVGRLPQPERWKRLSRKDRAAIAWKVLLSGSDSR